MRYAETRDKVRPRTAHARPPALFFGRPCRARRPGRMAPLSVCGHRCLSPRLAHRRVISWSLSTTRCTTQNTSTPTPLRPPPTRLSATTRWTLGLAPRAASPSPAPAAGRERAITFYFFYCAAVFSTTSVTGLLVARQVAKGRTQPPGCAHLPPRTVNWRPRDCPELSTTNRRTVVSAAQASGSGEAGAEGRRRWHAAERTLTGRAHILK